MFPGLQIFILEAQMSFTQILWVSDDCHAFTETIKIERVTFQRSAGRDATQIFFGLHRHEVLLRPQYARLQIGKVQGQEELIKPPQPGDLSKVPYAEPTWLSSGYYSPYYMEGHRKFQKAVRSFFMTVVQPESVKCEESGKRISQEVVDRMR